MSLINNNKIINETKTLFSVLKLRFGINYGKLNQILKVLGINKKIILKFNKLSVDQHQHLKFYFPDITLLDSELKRELIAQKEKYFELKCYKRTRYLLKLPVNGQRTRSNAKTVKKLKK